MNQVLTPQRLVQLSQFHTNLRDLWYLVAAVTFTVCNRSQEIPKLYHYALMTQNDVLRKDKGLICLAHSACDLVRIELANFRGSIDRIYSHPSLKQKHLTIRFREALLKSTPLTGLPKSINVLNELRAVTPTSLLPKSKPLDPWKAARHEEGVCPNSKRQVLQSQDAIILRGLDHWNQLYTKVSTKIVNNLNSSYPDLWYYILIHVYGPILSYDEILSAQETSFIVLAALIPQDVNPQLKGHLKGAINIGCNPDTVEAVRSLSILVSQWCQVTWKSEVIKL